MLTVIHTRAMKGQFHVIASRPNRSEFCAASFPYASADERRALDKHAAGVAAHMGGRVLECVAADSADRFCHQHCGPLAYCACTN